MPDKIPDFEFLNDLGPMGLIFIFICFLNVGWAKTPFLPTGLIPLVSPIIGSVMLIFIGNTDKMAIITTHKWMVLGIFGFIVGVCAVWGHNWIVKIPWVAQFVSAKTGNTPVEPVEKEKE